MPPDAPDAQDTPGSPHDAAAAAPLALPSTSDASPVALGEQVKLDKLGPVVVRAPPLTPRSTRTAYACPTLTQTLARLPNWDKMTPDEQQRTVRILAKRNQARLEKLRQPPSS